MSSFPFPTLSLFTIYTNTLPPVSNNNDEKGQEGEEDLTDKKTDSELELEKILFFNSNELNSNKKERKIRLIGTIIGMADFAKMLSNGNAPNVKSVHSLNKRMLWIEPEKGYFIHLTIDLPQSTTKQHTKESSVDSNQEYKTSINYLEDEPLLEALSLAYSSYRLHQGTFQGLMMREGKQKLTEQIEKFWSRWLEKWSLQNVIPTGLESVVGGFREYFLPLDSKLQLDPLVSQFKVSNPLFIPIILHGSRILSLPLIESSSSIPSDNIPKETTSSIPIRKPETLPLTTKDLNALVEQILSTIPSPPLIPNVPLKKKLSRVGNLQSSIMTPSSSSTSSIEKSTTTKSESSSSSSSSKWNTYTLGMGSYLTSSVNATSNSVPSMKTMVNLPSLAMNSALNLPISSLSAFIPDAITRRKESGSSIVEPVEVGIKVGDNSGNLVEDEVVKPIIKVSELDSLSLTEAINDEETLNSSSISISTSIEVIEEPILVQPLSYYCGTGNSKDTLMEVRIYKRGLLTLALASPTIESSSSTIDNKASRLLEAIESILQDSSSSTSNTSTITSSHRTLIRTDSFKSSNNWPTGNDVWSGRNSNEAQEVEGTLFDCYRGLQSEPKILETFIRLNSKHWIFASRNSDAITSERKDVYAVLPSKIGIEGSFIDASEEIRKLLDST